MLKLFFNLVVLLKLGDISKKWKTEKCTWDIDNCETYNCLPWKFGELPMTTTYSNQHSFSQQYGRFRAKFKMNEKWCWWLLQLEKNQYLEIDHFEIFDKHVGLCSWKNTHFNSQRRIPWREFINPKCEIHIAFMKDIYSRRLFGSSRVRKYILEKPRRYEIIWRKWFILWKVDGWPCGIMFRDIPRQDMYPILSGPEENEILEMQIRL